MTSLPFTSIRLADFGGKISWKKKQKFEMTFCDKLYKFSIQTPRVFAVVEKKIYKHWRIVMRKDWRLAARVIAEFDTRSECHKAFNGIRELFAHPKQFEPVLQKDNQHLEHGDVISVPTKMLSRLKKVIGVQRHFGVYDAIRDEVIEYQPVPNASLSEKVSTKKGQIQATPFDEFKTRVENIYDGEFDLRKHFYFANLNKHPLFTGSETVERARSHLNTKSYDAVFKNCESFAVWAKTGISQSFQSADLTEAAWDLGIKVGILCAVIATVYVGVAYVPMLVQVSPIPKTTILKHVGVKLCKHVGIWVGSSSPLAAISGGVHCKLAVGAAGVAGVAFVAEKARNRKLGAGAAAAAAGVAFVAGKAGDRFICSESVKIYFAYFKEKNSI